MPRKTFDSFRAEAGSIWARPAKARGTVTKMRQALREFGATLPAGATMAAVTAPAVAAWANGQLAAGRHPNTVRSLLSYLRAACSYAVEVGHLARSPFARRRSFVRGVRATGPAAHTGAELACVLRALEARRGLSWRDGRTFALVSLVAYTGLRRNEALNLSWAEVDLAARLIRLDPARGLKTFAAAQPVPIPDRLAGALAWWRGRCDSEWVVPGRTRRRPWTGGSLGSRPIDHLKAAGRAVGVEGLTFASLRATWATLAESTWGLSGPLIQRVLRHTTLATQEHYRRADERALVAAVRGIDFAAA